MDGDRYRDVKQQVDAVFAPLHGLQQAVTKEAGIPAAFLALFTSTIAITLGKYLTSALTGCRSDSC
jgi:hypothetical protein